LKAAHKVEMAVVSESSHHNGLGSHSPPHEAVVLPMRNVEDECHFQRLLALALSSSADVRHRDVWFLHDHKSPPTNSTRVDILAKAGVFVASQPDIPAQGGWPSFGGKDSGDTKPSFLVFASRHSEYDFFWFLEDDALFTGKWSSLFDSPYQSNAVVTEFLDPLTLLDSSSKQDNMIHQDIKSGMLEDKRWERFLELLATKGNSRADIIGHFSISAFPDWWGWKGCKVLGHTCLESNRTQANLQWMAARFSKRYVQALATALSDKTQSRATHGHHEGVAATFCVLSSWCSMEQLQNRGVFQCFNQGRYMDPHRMTLSYLSSGEPPYHVQMSRVYHPVKCEASSTVGAEALQYAGVHRLP